MKELTKEQLSQEMKGTKQEMQLIFVDDLLNRIKHFTNNTNRFDYKPSHQEIQKIQKIKRYLDTILKNIG